MTQNTCFVRGVLLTRSARSKGRAYYAHKHENRKRRVRVRTFVFPQVAPRDYLCSFLHDMQDENPSKNNVSEEIIIILNCTHCRPFQVYSKTEKANLRTN